MQGSSDSQHVGEIVSPPPSVQINSPQKTDSVQAPMMDQPPMQEDVIYQHRSRSHFNSHWTVFCVRNVYFQVQLFLIFKFKQHLVLA